MEIVHQRPSGDMACARTPDPPGIRSSGRISGTSRCSERQNSSRLKERRNSFQHVWPYAQENLQSPGNVSVSARVSEIDVAVV